MPAGPHLTRWPSITPAALEEATTNAGLGLDHPNEEQPLALLRYDFPDRGETIGSMASLVVGDRRVFGRLKATNIPDWTFDVRYADVTSSRFESGLLNTKLHLEVAGRRLTFPIWGTQLRDLFLGVQRLAPADRWAPPPPPAPHEGDPTGALAAFSRAISGDARVGALLRVIHEGSRGGVVADGAARVAQVELLDRQLRLARGMNQGWWLTTLSPSVLESLLVELLGAPLQRWDEPGGAGLDLPLSGRSGSSFASSVVGVALLATVGVGWVTLPRGPAPRLLRAQIVGRPWGSGLSLQASSGGAFAALSSFAPELTRAISSALARVEPRALLTETLLGPAEHASQLLSVPREALEQRVAALLGPGDLSAFFPLARR